MKRLVLVVAILALTGCAYFTERMDAAGKCASDPACLASVQEKARIAKAMGDASGFPWAGTAASVVVTGAMLFFARRKKDNGKS